MQQCLKLINRLPGGQQKAAAIEQIAQAMKQGNAGQFTELQFELATLHHEGRHLPKDAARAAGWYRKAASEGHTSAQLNLALMLLEGEGVKADPVEAHKWFLKAAEQGNAEGQVALGMMFALGQGTEVDLIQAHKWVSLSSKSGNEDAATALKQLNTKLTTEQLVESAKLVRNPCQHHVEVSLLGYIGDDGNSLSAGRSDFSDDLVCICLIKISKSFFIAI